MSSINKKQLLPKLRFPEFWDEGEWAIKPLDSLAKRVINRNNGAKLKRVLTNSAVNGVVDQRDYFEKDIANQSNLDNYFIIDVGDYVYNPRISATAPAGPISKNKIGKGVMSPIYTVFRFNDHNDFYEQYFKTTSWHKYMQSISNSGARYDRMSILNRDFMNMPLPYPSLPEQQKISDCLTSLDQLITAEAAKLEAYKAHKKGLMQKLFPAEGETVPEWRFPEFQGKGEWVNKKLGQLCKINNNQRKPVSSGDRVKGIYPYYGASGIIGYINDYLFDERLLLVGEDGAKWGPFEKTAFIADGKYWVNNHAHVLKPIGINDTLLENYLVMLDLNPFITGAAPPKLTLGKLREIPISVPTDCKEQQKIADCLSSLDVLINSQDQQINALKYHTKALMQGLFPSIHEVGV